jgi:hypothetical protein
LIFSSIFILIVICVKSFSKGLDFKLNHSIFVVVSSLSLIILLDYFNLKDYLCIFSYMVYLLSYEFLFKSTVHIIIFFKEFFKELIKELIKLNNVLFMDNTGGSSSTGREGGSSRGGYGRGGYSGGGKGGYSGGGNSSDRGGYSNTPGIGGSTNTGGIGGTDSNTRGIKRDLQAYLSDIAKKALKHGNLNSNPDNATRPKPNPNNSAPNTVITPPGPNTVVTRPASTTLISPTVSNAVVSTPIQPIASTAISTRPITSNPPTDY